MFAVASAKCLQRAENSSGTINPEEFARLIGSGRVEDLRIFARRLSAQPKTQPKTPPKTLPKTQA